MIKNKYKIKGDVIYVKATNTNDTFLIDKDQKEILDNTSWYRGLCKWSEYIKCCKHNKEIKLHRLILNITDPKIHIDHINGNVLDNRKSNLRISNNATNHMNQKIRKDNRSGYKGVTKRCNKWIARIGKSGSINLGSFNTPEEAARAYDAKAKELYGDFACLNFKK